MIIPQLVPNQWFWTLLKWEPEHYMAQLMVSEAFDIEAMLSETMGFHINVNVTEDIAGDRLKFVNDRIWKQQ